MHHHVCLQRNSNLFKFYSGNDVRKRRKFFENYAKENHFDPLKAENWYSHPLSKIKAGKDKRVISVVQHHGGSLSKALLDLFPGIGLDKSELKSSRRWTDAGNRRKFFENYAKQCGFDPLLAENWYSESLLKIKSMKKGIQRVMSYHNWSWKTALLDLFPNIGLERSKFAKNS